MKIRDLTEAKISLEAIFQSMVYQGRSMAETSQHMGIAEDDLRHFIEVHQDDLKETCVDNLKEGILGIEPDAKIMSWPPRADQISRFFIRGAKATFFVSLRHDLTMVVETPQEILTVTPSIIIVLEAVREILKR